MSLQKTKTFAQIMDEMGRENTQALIKNDLLLETDYPNNKREHSNDS